MKYYIWSYNIRDDITVSGSNITKPNGINDASVNITSMLVIYSLEIQLLFVKIHNLYTG